MQCPHCGEWFWGASAWDSGEPDFRPGVLCPHCRKFIDDEEAAEILQSIGEEEDPPPGPLHD